VYGSETEIYDAMILYLPASLFKMILTIKIAHTGNFYSSTFGNKNEILNSDRNN